MTEHAPVLVTGGAGFIGSTLCRLLLQAGRRVRVLDAFHYGGASLLPLLNDPNFELLQGDIRDRKAVDRALHGVAAVVHLAALVGDKLCDQNREAAVAINYHATRDLVAACLRQRVGRFVFASTSSNYGVMDTSRAADETAELHPVSLYAETKVDCEKFLLELREPRLAPVLFRFSSGFGVSGRIRFDLTVNSFAYEAWRDNEIVVFAANTWRPYMHVYDLARCLMIGLAAPAGKVAGQVFNAGGDELNHPKSEIAALIKAARPGIAVSTIEKKDLRTYRLSFEKIRRVLRFRPARTVADGIAELLQAFDAGMVSNEYFLDNGLERIKTIR